MKEGARGGGRVEKRGVQEDRRKEMGGHGEKGGHGERRGKGDNKKRRVQEESEEESRRKG
jgi:hypothetical protein